MKEQWVDQEKFYSYLKCDELHELVMAMNESEEGVFYFIPKGFEEDYSDFKVPVIIFIKVVDTDASLNKIIAIDFKSNFVPPNLEKYDEGKLRGIMHFFEKLLGFQFVCFTQGPIDDYSRFFGIFNSFLQLDVKLLIANENAFSKLHIPKEEMPEKFENIIYLTKLIKAMRDLGIFIREWTKNFEKRAFFKPSVAVSGFDIVLSFNNSYYITKSSVLLTDTDRNSLRLLLIAAFTRFIDTLSRTFQIGKKIPSEYEAAFSMELIKPENVGKFVEILRKVSENFEGFFYSDLGFVHYIDRLSKIINAREAKINQIKKQFNLVSTDGELYKLLALASGTTSKSIKALFERAFFNDLKFMNSILKDFAEETEKFFMGVIENA